MSDDTKSAGECRFPECGGRYRCDCHNMGSPDAIAALQPHPDRDAITKAVETLTGCLDRFVSAFPACKDYEPIKEGYAAPAALTALQEQPAREEAETPKKLPKSARSQDHFFARHRAPPREEAEALQARVQPWMMACFGPEISADRLERGDRLLEEVLELLQSGGYPPERVAALRDYVWSRPAGEPHQEAGGVMITHAAYCLAHKLDMHQAGEDELARIWTKVEKIRAKQATKPVGSALPIPVHETSSAREEAEALVSDYRALADCEKFGVLDRMAAFIARKILGEKS